MRRNVLWAVVVVGTALIQTTWLDAIRVQGVVPNLPLLLVVYFAIVDGEERAMFTGALGGVFQDVAGNVTLGLNVLCLVVVGYAAGRISTRLITEHPVVKTGLVFIASIVHGALSITIQYVQDPHIAAFHNLFARVVPAAFYTALATPVLFFLMDRAFRRQVPLQGETA